MKKHVTNIIVIAIGILVGVTIAGSVANKRVELGGLNTVNSPATATSSNISLPANASLTIVATSTKRSSLVLFHNGTDGEVFCNANDGKSAIVGEGIYLSATTSPMYEFTVDKGNLTTDGIHCISENIANDVLSVIEFNTTR